LEYWGLIAFGDNTIRTGQVSTAAGRLGAFGDNTNSGEMVFMHITARLVAVADKITCGVKTFPGHWQIVFSHYF
jgi:hypothetical protein